MLAVANECAADEVAAGPGLPDIAPAALKLLDEQAIEHPAYGVRVASATGDQESLAESNPVGCRKVDFPSRAIRRVTTGTGALLQ